MSMLSKAQIKEFIAHYNIQAAEDIQAALKDLFADTLQAMLEAELDTKGFYSPHIRPNA